MIRSGLCSISFRQLSADEIIRASVASGLQAIEWGGDIHCPHGDVSAAASLRRRCADVGITTTTYGSYFRMDPEWTTLDFRHVVDSAVALGAHTIRVWAGGRASRDMDSEYRQRLAAEIRRIAGLATQAGCSIGLEYHGNTATDTNESALQLLKEIDHPAVKTYWQPREGTSEEERLEGLSMVLPWLCHLHVFHWVGVPVERRPLTDAEQEWRRYVKLADTESGLDRYAFLEFMPRDSIEELSAEVSALRRILGLVPGV
jgi:sugar phosphate isomerase/epimerase